MLHDFFGRMDNYEIKSIDFSAHEIFVKCVFSDSETYDIFLKRYNYTEINQVHFDMIDLDDTIDVFGNEAYYAYMRVVSSSDIMWKQLKQFIKPQIASQFLDE